MFLFLFLPAGKKMLVTVVAVAHHVLSVLLPLRLLAPLCGILRQIPLDSVQDSSKLIRKGSSWPAQPG